MMDSGNVSDVDDAADDKDPKGKQKGMVKVQWQEILDQAEKALDRDGDGKFDISDAKIWWNDLLTILTWNMPGGSGFLFGLYYALS